MAVGKSAKQSNYLTYYALVALFVSIAVYGYLNNYFTHVVHVHTRFGGLQGFAQTSRDGRVFYQYNTIPYAKAPLGKLRFQPPSPAEVWKGMRDATRLTPNCLQYDFAQKAFRGQEDCLFLNVYTPQNPAAPVEKTLPVMVFIHGGLYMFGGSGELYSGRYFMDEDVILVTINYRLGVLGFLNTGDEVASGNQGLKDQLEAIKFVKATIEDFGGDPNRITIFGESAGGVSVHYHMLSPQSKGYFKSAISQSGSALSPWAFTRNPREQAVRFGNLVDCPTNSSHELVDCLTELDPWELIKPHANLQSVFADSLDVFGPSVENVTSETLRSKAFLTESPYKLAIEGKTHPVPYIAGVNSHEGCFRSAWLVGYPPLLDKMNREWNDVASSLFFLYQNDTRMLEKLHEYFFHGKDVLPKDYESLTHLIGDRLFTMPARDAALLHSKSGRNTYLYYFTEKPEISIGDILASMDSDSWLPRLLEVVVNVGLKKIYTILNVEMADYGTCHADDLTMLLPVALTSLVDFKEGHKHYEFSKKLVKMWAAFATRGEPGEADGAQWEKVITSNKTAKSTSSTVPKYFHLNSKKMKMIEEPFHSRVAFWTELKLPRNLLPEEETVYGYEQV